MHFPQMRNNYVLVRVLQKKAQKVGLIEVTNNMSKAIDEVEILGVGPGTTSINNTTLSTSDLRCGQICEAKMRSYRELGGGGEQVREDSIAFVWGNEALSIIHESQIIAIVKEADVA